MWLGLSLVISFSTKLILSIPYVFNNLLILRVNSLSSTSRKKTSYLVIDFDR